MIANTLLAPARTRGGARLRVPGEGLGGRSYNGRRTRVSLRLPPDLPAPRGVPTAGTNPVGALHRGRRAGPPGATDLPGTRHRPAGRAGAPVVGGRGPRRPTVDRGDLLRLPLAHPAARAGQPPLPSGFHPAPDGRRVRPGGGSPARRPRAGPAQAPEPLGRAVHAPEPVARPHPVVRAGR